MTTGIRNIAIIAHVDHGKTTLVDKLLRQAGVFRQNEAVRERAMDSMDLEREKGITIKSKNAAVNWQGVRINIVDTPGHADFGGEVERILKMVDGVLLLVDAVEGPQAQTRFVLKKALENKLKLIVVINKIDREHADPERVHEEILELLLDLEADDNQFHAPILYASAKAGFAVNDPTDPHRDMSPLFDRIVEYIPPPQADTNAPFEMLISNLDWSDYVGRIAIGKITGGSVQVGDSIHCIHRDGRRERGQVTKLFTFSGMGIAETERGHAGDIVSLSGFDEIYIGETLCANEEQPPIPFVAIDPPTVQMQFRINDGPLAGRDGQWVTARHIQERLLRETRINVSLEMAEGELANTFMVSARGALQIAVLVETMRREDFEVLVSRPEVIYHIENGHKLEPFEDLWVEVPNDCLGDVMQNLAWRKATITSMDHIRSRVHLKAVLPTRGLIGLETFLANLTSGEALISHMFKEYAEIRGAIKSRNNGVLVSMERGTATAYALDALQNRGRLFIGPHEEVYPGMIIGENARPGDLLVNPTKTKQLTNVRASGSDKAIQLEPPVVMSLEKAIEYITPDEYVEATPSSIRLRKKVLDSTKRKRIAQAASAQ